MLREHLELEKFTHKLDETLTFCLLGGIILVRIEPALFALLLMSSLDSLPVVIGGLGRSDYSGGSLATTLKVFSTAIGLPSEFLVPSS